MSEAGKTIGIFTGVLDVYVARYATEDTTAAAPTYDPPKVLGASIEVTITPQYAEATLEASNRVVRRSKRIKAYSIKANVDTVSPEMKDYVLGRKKDKNGVTILDGSTDAPSVAIGLCRTKDTGAKELWWLYKGRTKPAARPTRLARRNIRPRRWKQSATAASMTMPLAWWWTVMMKRFRQA